MTDPNLDPDTLASRKPRGTRPGAASSPDSPMPRQSAGVPLGKRFESVARAHGDAVAVVDGARRISYRELLERADAIAAELQARGIGPRNLVGVALPRSIDLVVAVVGVTRAGAAYVPIDLSHPAERRALILSDAHPRVVVTDGSSLEGVPGGTEVLAVPDAVARAKAPFAVPAGSDPAYVIYTSGSTGVPNGVSVTQHNAARLFTAAEPLFGFGPDDVWTLFHSIAFDFSVWELWGALLHGGRLVVVPGSTTRAADEFHALVVREGVTVLNQTPSAFRAFDAADVATGRPPNRLRYVVFGGEALDPRTLKNWFDAHGDEQPRLVNMYGITETTVHVTFRRMRPKDARGTGKSLIGAPLPDMRVELLGPDGRPVADGDVGEIWVGGEGVSAGYVGRPALTADRFRPDPRADHPNARQYRSGDLGRRLPDGDLEYLGRADLQVKLRGFRIELGEIEAALRDFRDVRDAMVSLRDDPVAGPRLVAYLVLDRQSALDADTLREALARRLPDYMVPAAYVRIDRIPRTVNDKVDRTALPAPTPADFPRGTGGDAPRDVLEKTIAQIFSEVLDSPVTARDADFFRLGGHSLLAVRVAILAQARLDVELSANAVFGHPTVAALADFVRGERERGRRAKRVVRAQRGKPVPLSPQQYALWLETKLRSDADAYNESVALRVEGHLDPARLRRALEKLAEAHEVLRARLIESDGEPHFVFDRDARAFDFLDLSVASARTHALGESMRRPFDLAKGPLWRVEVRHEEDGSSTLLLVVHHIVLDAASQRTLLNDLAAAYADPEGGLAPRAFQFLDLCAHERDRLETDRKELERFWSTALLGSELSPELPPPCVPCAPGEEDQGCASRRAIEPRLARAIRELAANWGTTPFHLYLAAFLGLLRTYTSRNDLVVGSPVSLRDAPEAEGVVGYLLSPAVLRVQLSGARSFQETVEDVARRWQEVRAHARLPMHLVLQAARGAQRAGMGSPVQVFFSLVQDAVEGVRFEGRAVSPIRLAPAHVKFKLFLLVEERQHDATMVLEFPRGVFDPEMGDRLLEHLEVLLRTATERPETSLAQLPLAGSDEKHAIEAWGTHAKPYPREQPVGALFERVAREHPGATAIIAGDARLTYAELDARANAVAAALRAAGVRRGDRVPVLAPRGAKFIACVLGAMKCGAAYVPLDSSYPPERLRRMLDGLGVRVGLRTPELRPAEGEIVWLNASVADDEASTPPPTSDVGPEDAAYVMFTSGSTGRPKGVEIPHRAIVRLVFAQDFAQMGPEQNWLHMAPTSFDASTLEIWAPLLHGGCCTVVEEAVPTPLLLESTIRRHGVTSAWITSSLFNALVDEAPRCLAGLTQILVGGEALSVPHVRRALDQLPHCRLVNGYGPTENTTFTCCHVIRRADVERGRSIPIGRPIANTTVSVLDHDGRSTPLGVPGEIVTGGDGVALGYVGQPERTAEFFLPDKASARPGARAYRTGDRARWRPDGVLEFLARFDDQVKIRGHRVEPGDIAACLLEHEAVRQAVVVARPSASGTGHLVAYVVPWNSETAHELPRVLARHASERLPAYMIPASFVPVVEFPLKPNGKIDLVALQTATHDKAMQRRDAHLSAVEVRVLGIWRDLLGDPALGVDEDFFEAGGDSLLAVRMLSRLEREFGRAVPARALIEAGTARRLSASLESSVGSRSAHPPGVVEMRAGTSARPLFYIPGMGSVAFQFRVLAKKLRTRRPILALELHDMDIAPAVLGSLTDTAEAVVRRMRQVQPVGPYTFIGYSYGGNLAVEVARRLMNENQSVELVAVLDAYAPGSLRDPGQISKLVRHLRIVMRMKRHEAYEYVSSKLMGWFRGTPADAADAEPAASSHGSEIERRIAETSELCSAAFRAYQPGPFPGRIVLVHATDLGDWMEAADPTGTCGWGPICTRGVDIIPIGCRHLDLFKEPHLSTVARHLDALLDAIDGDQGSKGFR